VIIWTESGSFGIAAYSSEADLEQAILTVQKALFGSNRIYLDVKRKIGTRGGVRNIPDGYLIDLSGNKPRLYVIENELAAHDPLRHIAVQILQFSLSFEAEPRLVKKILFEALQEQSDAKQKCEEYATRHNLRNLDYLLEYLVFEAPFAAIVIIDEIPENLQSVLSRKFQFGVEVIELRRYEDSNGRRLYQFEPFLADLTDEIDRTRVDQRVSVDTSEIDTVVVPAQADGMDVFLKENRWYAVRIHGAMRPQIKYIAVYQTKPEQAITYAAPVKSIEPWKETDKVVVNFSESAHQLKHPITLAKGGRVKAPQNIRYASWERLNTSKTLDDLW